MFIYLISFFTLSYFILALLMRECLRKNSCMSSSFPIVILNGTYFFQPVQLEVHNVYSERKSRNTCTLVNLYLQTKLMAFWGFNCFNFKYMTNL